MASKRYVLAEGEVKASLFAVWIQSPDGKQHPVALSEPLTQKLYHKKVRLVLEVKHGECQLARKRLWDFGDYAQPSTQP